MVWKAKAQLRVDKFADGSLRIDIPATHDQESKHSYTRFDQRWEYDSHGRLTHYSNGNDDSYYEFDNQNRIKRFVQGFTLMGSGVSYELAYRGGLLDKGAPTKISAQRWGRHSINGRGYVGLGDPVVVSNT